MDNLLIGVDNEEFYSGEEKILFLGNIKTLNLFIGANNTRKSRLLRSIARLDQKQILSSQVNLEQLKQDTYKILKSLEDAFDQFPKVSLIRYRSSRDNVVPDKRFSYLRMYFDATSSPDVNFNQLKNLLEQIFKEYQAYINQEMAISLQDRTLRFYDIVDLLDYVYELAAGGVDITAITNNGRLEEGNANSISFSIPDRDEFNKIANLQFKSKIIADLKELLGRYLTLKTQILKPKCIYIPVLRSSRNLLNANRTINEENLFRSTVNYQYFGAHKAPGHITVHTGQDHYELIDKAKRGKTHKRRDFDEFEAFIGRSFFQSKDIEIIAYNDDGERDIIVNLPGERPDVAIHDLGDGVQAIINIFFPIFTAAECSWIFIDEPELNMHPGFQNLMIRTLAENSFLKQKNLRYFINSHSNHILSEMLLGNKSQSEIFVFHRRDEYSSTVRSFEGFENATLDLLGVLNTSTLISNCSIWVEGITDRIYLRAYLTAFLKDRTDFLPIEGLNYSFIEYGGKNIVHYLFEDTMQPGLGTDPINAWFINSRIFLLADTDKGKEKLHEEREARQTQRFVYEQTRLTEIENIVPNAVLSSYLTDKLGIPHALSLEVMKNKKEYIGLGKYLQGRFDKLGIQRKISTPSGTLKNDYKSSLAEYVLMQVQKGSLTWRELRQQDDIKRITHRLFDFIALSNQRSDVISPV
ncbi:AAA family ATPase [Pedobacter sp. PWIIR3]